MPDSIDLTFTKSPSFFITLLAAIPGMKFSFDPAEPVPVIIASRRGIKPDAGRLAEFTGVCAIGAGESLPPLYPLAYMYPLVQRILSRKEAPLSLLKTLNSRMEIVVHRPIGLNEPCDVSCKLTAHRVVEKGLEVDIACMLQISGETVWECTITFCYHGRFGEPDKTFASPQWPAIPDAPEIARWFLPEGIGLRFAKISGDGNPIHFSAFYAKRLGFAGDFAQPLLVLTKALTYLSGKGPSEKLHLNIAFKGPVYYGKNVLLKSADDGQTERFDIYSEANSRPAICGSLRRR